MYHFMTEYEELRAVIHLLLLVKVYKKFLKY